MSENASSGPADSSRPQATVEFCSDSQLIDVDESETTPSKMTDAMRKRLEEKYGRPKKRPETPPEKK
jgi:hypothetical protein